MTPAKTYLLGVDPAATTGFAFCSAEPGGLRLLEAWHVTRPTPTKSRTQAECDAAVVPLIVARLDAAFQRSNGSAYPLAFDGPLHLAIEDPSDVSALWGHSRQGGRVSARGTACRIGAAYGLALAGVTAAVAFGRIMSYQVRGTAHRPGWMTGLFGRTATRKSVYDRLRLLLRATPRRAEDPGNGLTEDELAAYGVALWHWTLSQATARRIAT